MSWRQSDHVRQFLRRSTSAAHHALDHHPLMQRLVSSDLTREQYAESLAAMYLPHARLERLVHGSSHHSESCITLRARSELLQADLFELGKSAPPLLPIASHPSGERAAWWGRVYVLEGSRLGGAVISRRIRSSLGDSVPCRFFAEVILPGEHTVLWALLERELQGQDDLEQAAAGAQAAFGAYKADLDAFDGAIRPVNDSLKELT